MKPPSDDLENLWQSALDERKTDPQALLAELQRRGRSFHRTIHRRDWRESAGGVFAAIFFLWQALLHAKSPLERVADFWLAGYGVWVVFYLFRYSRPPGAPDPDQTLDGFREALLRRYDDQIQLLRSVKYWYLLPVWAGIMLIAVATLLRTGSIAHFAFLAGLNTAVNLAVWWMNESPGVRNLQKQKCQVIQLFGEEGEAQ